MKDRAHSASDASSSAKRSQELVLIVNDLPDQLDLMSTLLRKSGYDVIKARDGLKGYGAALAARPDIIISDVSMPRMDGIEMCRLLREHDHLQAIPILLVSAVRRDSQSAVEGLRAGADDYQEVPYDPMRLVARVARLIERKRFEESLRQGEERYRLMAESALEAACRLEESEQRYRSLFNYNPDAIFSLDTEGRFVSTNQAAQALTGLEADELVGRDLLSLFSAEVRERMSGYMQRTLAGETQCGDISTRLRNGRLVELSFKTMPVVVNGHVTGLYGVVKDITEHKRAEERLKKSEAQLAEAQQIAHIGSFEWDAVTKNSTWSDEFYRILGLDPQSREVSDELLASYFFPTEFELLKQLFGKALRNENFVCEHRLTRVDGALRVLQVRGQRVLDDEGNTAKVIGTVQDITELKEAEAALRKSEEQFLQAQKMDAIGQLAGGIAHDFNNHLTTIMGYSDLALRNLDAVDPLRRNLEEIRKSGKRAASLTRQLLAFSRKQVLQPRPLGLNAVVDDMVQMLLHLIGENISLRTFLSPVLGTVRADPGQIEQVILNLAVNARDAMPEGGKLTIETQNVHLDASYARDHKEVVPGRYVLLTVSDTGSGMDAETQERIFEPFFTTKVAGKGTGLGLSTVYGIVKQSGGHIFVYSEIRVGTTFKIYLPRIDKEVEECSHKVEGTAVPRGTKTVLVAEDEEMLRELTREALESNGYEVLVAANGAEALRICEQHASPIHLLLTDVVMPEISGRVLSEQAQRIHPETVILYMSGYTDEAIVHHGVLDEGTNFIQKPFTLDSLAQKVRAVLDEAAS